MARVNPVDAAFEGFRIIRDRPQVILAWTGFYFVSVLLMIGILLLPVLLSANFGEWAGAERLGGQRDFDQLLSRYGLPIFIVIPLAMLMLTMLATAVYRAVLKPDDRRWAYLRFSGAEARMFGLAVMVLVAFTAIGALLLWVPALLIHAADSLVEVVATVGGVMAPVLALLLLLFVWLSAIAGTATVATERFGLVSSARMIGREFGRMVVTGALTGLLMLGVTVFSLVVSFFLAGLLGGLSLLGELANPDLSGVSPGLALGLLAQLLLQLLIQMLVFVLLLTIAYGAACRAYRQAASTEA